jgi:urease gamma subunit
VSLSAFRPALCQALNYSESVAFRFSASALSSSQLFRKCRFPLFAKRFVKLLIIQKVSLSAFRQALCQAFNYSESVAFRFSASALSSSQLFRKCRFPLFGQRFVKLLIIQKVSLSAFRQALCLALNYSESVAFRFSASALSPQE